MAAMRFSHMHAIACILDRSALLSYSRKPRHGASSLMAMVPDTARGGIWIPSCHQAYSPGSLWRPRFNPINGLETIIFGLPRSIVRLPIEKKDACLIGKPVIESRSEPPRTALAKFRMSNGGQTGTQELHNRPMSRRRLQPNEPLGRRSRQKPLS